jgi:hypothetical protein
MTQRGSTQDKLSERALCVNRQRIKDAYDDALTDDGTRWLRARLSGALWRLDPYK